MRSPQSTEKIIQAYAEVARRYILQWFPQRNSCIAAVRATIEVLDRFNIHAWPLAVRMKTQVEAAEVGFGSGLLPEERARLAKHPNAKPLEGAATGWDGHLIVGTEHGWLIDPTFDTTFEAFRKMGYDCGMRDYVLAVNAGKEVDPLGFHMDAVYELNDGKKLQVVYLSSPNEEYRQAPAWETDHLYLLIEMLVLAIQERLRKPSLSAAAAQIQSPD